MTEIQPPPRYWFEWHQDTRRRVLRLAGRIDATAAGHLANGIIDLRGRRLVVDLSEAGPSDAGEIAPEVVAALIDMARRLGAGRVTVVVGPNQPLALEMLEGSALLEGSGLEITSRDAAD